VQLVQQSNNNPRFELSRPSSDSTGRNRLKSLTYSRLAALAQLAEQSTNGSMFEVSNSTATGSRSKLQKNII
jgi:hypothetical protein